MDRGAVATEAVARLRPFVDALLDAVGRGAGTAAAAMRSAAFDQAPRPLTLPRDRLLADYVAKVRALSYRVDANDIETLLAAGVSEEEVFEITVAAALAEGNRRLERGLATLGLGE